MKKNLVFIVLFLQFVNLISQTNPTAIYIRGTGLNRNEARILKIGNQTIYHTASGRGLRLTIVSKADISVVFDRNYDCFGATTVSESLATKLNTIDQNQIGILTSYDAWENQVTANLDNAFLRLGLTIAMGTVNSGSRRPYAAIFEGASNGETTGKAIEVSYNYTTNKPYAEIRGFFIEGSFVASGSQSNALLKPQGDGVGAIVDNNGNVGIGTTTPKYKLDVAGIIRANEILVEDIAATNLQLEGNIAANQITVKANGNTADFVFSDTYNLKDLTEVKNYIKTHKHLPDIPSAEEMEASGVNLAEMNKLLLQKVEELTLYAIQQEIERKKELGERKALETALNNEHSARVKIEIEMESMRDELITIKEIITNNLNK